MKYAILIDAGFVKRKLASYESPLDAPQVGSLIQEISQHDKIKNMHLLRVYFYDAPPIRKSVNKPLGGGKIRLGETMLAKQNDKLHREISKYDYVALRLGEVRFRGWRLNDKELPVNGESHALTHDELQPNIQQKGVDMKIGLDIATLSLKKQVELIVLVTGDSDFVSPMKFARREGVQFAVVTLGHKVHADLITNADFALDISPAKTKADIINNESS